MLTTCSTFHFTPFFVLPAKLHDLGDRRNMEDFFGRAGADGKVLFDDFAHWLLGHCVYAFTISLFDFCTELCENLCEFLCATFQGALSGIDQDDTIGLKNALLNWPAIFCAISCPA